MSLLAVAGSAATFPVVQQEILEGQKKVQALRRDFRGCKINLETARQNEANLSRKLEEASADLKELKEARTSAQDAISKMDMRSCRERMNFGHLLPRIKTLTAAHYEIKKLANTELVSGLLGNYYAVTLRERYDLGGDAFKFNNGEYKRLPNESNFEAHFREFADDIIQAIPPEQKTQLLVRAFADGREFKRALVIMPKFSTIRLITKKAESGKYLGKVTEINVPSEIPRKLGNFYLPNLRAQYIKNYYDDNIKEHYKRKGQHVDMTILEGSELAIGSKRARGFEFILFHSSD